VVTGRDADKTVVSLSSGIKIGDEITFTHIDGQLRAETRFDLEGPGETQSLKIHTSCLVPLELGDVFGSMELVAINERQLGEEVEYLYTVTNPGSDSVSDIQVMDSEGLEVDCPPDSLGSGELMECRASEIITDDTTNFATASGRNESGQTCTSNEAD
jgi:hypothetical protein